MDIITQQLSQKNINYIFGEKGIIFNLETVQQKIKKHQLDNNFFLKKKFYKSHVGGSTPWLCARMGAFIHG